MGTRLRRLQGEPTGLFSNYCGFGGEGPVQHEIDELCRIHDKDYGTIAESGKNPYRAYNW